MSFRHSRVILTIKYFICIICIPILIRSTNPIWPFIIPRSRFFNCFCCQLLQNWTKINVSSDSARKLWSGNLLLKVTGYSDLSKKNSLKFISMKYPPLLWAYVFIHFLTTAKAGFPFLIFLFWYKNTVSSIKFEPTVFFLIYFLAKSLTIFLTGPDAVNLTTL